jgi:ABC-2 type transport system permease protein
MSMVWWTAGIVALTAWLVGVYPVIRGSEAMQEFLDDDTPEILALFGVDPETFLTGAGYLQAQMFSFMAPIILIAFAIGMGVAATAREERNGTMDMLLSVPISRTSVLVQKAAVMALLSAVLVFAIALSLVVANPIVDLKLGLDGIAAISIGLWLLALGFGGLAMLIGAFTGSPSAAGGMAAFAAILAWFVNAFSSLFSWLESPSQLSPFSWYLDGSPLINGFTAGSIWAAIAVVATVGGAGFLFARRNIATEQAVVPEVAARRKKTKDIAPRATWLLGTVFGKTLWDRRKTVWLWAIGLASMTYITLAAWPAMSQDAEMLESLVESFPKEVLAMFGLTDPSAMSTAEGFVSSRTYGSVGPIVVIVFAITAMTSFVAREESTGVLDLVASNPLRRTKLLGDKTAGVWVLMGIIVAILTAVVFLGSAVLDLGFKAANMIGANVGLGLLGLCFWGIAIALWALIGSSGPAVGATAAFAVASFFMNGIGAIVDVLKPLRYVSPFYWYLGDTVPLNKSFTFGYLALAAVAVVGTAIALNRFQTRDLAV